MIVTLTEVRRAHGDRLVDVADQEDIHADINKAFAKAGAEPKLSSEYFDKVILVEGGDVAMLFKITKSGKKYRAKRLRAEFGLGGARCRK